MTNQTNYPLIAPSILSADFGDLTNEIKNIETAGADWIHIDVMDGSFVPPITFGDKMVATAKKATRLTLDTHLMIQNPEEHFESFKKAGCDRLTFHVEATKDPAGAIKKIQDLGMKAGISLKPATPVSAIEPYLSIVDLVLVMTVNPGWSGQSFMPECLPKIERVSNLINQQNLTVLIEVDGGINIETGSQCVKAGANVLVAGSFVFGAKSRKDVIAALKQCK